MDRTLKGKLYAQAHARALEHFTGTPDEDALDELTHEYYDDEVTQALQSQQAHLEVYSSEDVPANPEEDPENSEESNSVQDESPHQPTGQDTSSDPE